MSTKKKSLFRLRNIIGLLIAVIIVVALVWILNPSNEIAVENPTEEITEITEEVAEPVVEEASVDCVVDSDCGLYYICSAEGLCLHKADEEVVPTTTSSSSGGSSGGSSGSSSDSGSTQSTCDVSACSGYACDTATNACYTSCSSTEGLECASGYICGVVNQDGSMSCVADANGNSIPDVAENDLCSTNADCDLGYACNTSAGLCYTSCDSDNQCTSDAACDLEQNTCFICGESDSGVDIDVLSRTSGIWNSNNLFNSFSDTCIDGENLQEFYCTVEAVDAEPISDFHSQLAYINVSCTDGDYDFCYNGACSKLAGLGEICALAEDCASGICENNVCIECTSTELTNCGRGFACSSTNFCVQECIDSTTDCVDGYECSAGLCVSGNACTIDSDCTDGYACGSDSACYESCTTNDQCSSDAACVTNNINGHLGECVVCSDSDNGVDHYTQGSSNGVFVNNGKYYFENLDYCDGIGQNIDYFCYFTNGHEFLSYDGISCPSGYTCSNGACIVVQPIDTLPYEAPGTPENFLSRLFHWIFYRN